MSIPDLTRTEIETRAKDAYRAAYNGADPDRPLGLTSEDVDERLDRLRENITAMHTRRQEADAEREARPERERQAAEARVKDELKRRYLAVPGTSEAEFEKEYPTLLQDYRRDQVAAQGRQADAAAERARRAMRPRM